MFILHLLNFGVLKGTFFSSSSTPIKPTSVAQSDAHQSDDQETAGLIPAGYGNILS